jgi:hypothetical protein
MKQIKPGPGFAVFIVFFGIALLEAFRTQNWVMIIFWVVMGLVFILLENQEKHDERRQG